jgi:hypothetical protein
LVPLATALGPFRIVVTTDRGQQWIARQLVMVVKILVTQANGIDALTQHGQKRVLHPKRVASIEKEAPKRWV